MRVAIISYAFGPYVAQLGSALANHAEVLLVMPEAEIAPYKSALHPGIRTYFFDAPRMRQLPAQAQAMASIMKVIRAFDPDVMHVQQGYLWLNLALPFLRKRALVITVHDAVHHIGDGDSKRTPQFIFRLGHRQAQALIVHAEQIKRVLIDELKCPPERVHVITHIAHRDGATAPTITEQDGLILFFGRIWEYKGLEYLIRAEPLITAEVPHARIMIAGRGEDFSRYRAMMKTPEHFIVHNDFVPQERVGEFFQQASLVALPYIEASQSGVVLDAYAFARPVVATTVGGLPEVIDDGQTGILVPPRDERALADAIIRLLKDRALRVQMGANGRRKLERENAPALIAEQTLAAYKQALQDSRKR